MRHLLLALLLTSANVSAAPMCIDLIKSLQAPTPGQQSRKSPAFEKRTRIEEATQQAAPALPASDLLVEKIKSLDKSNPELALRVRKARELKNHGGSLLIDLSHLNGPMINFLEGAYRKVVGARGLSQPFVSFEKINEKTLVIRHEGDAYPLMVRWSADVSEPQLATSVKVKDQIYQALLLPESLVERQDLMNLADKYIYSLISGSSLNKYIAARGSDIMTIASVLHEGKATFDRPTQVESKQIRQLLNSDGELRKKLSSLLFVAPTASGKTKVLTDYLSDKVKRARESLQTDPAHGNKLSVLMTKTPDLTSDLAIEVGRQLNEELGSKNFRIIQWGGRLTEELSHSELIKFIEESEVPVVLVTSYPTFGTRARTAEAKSAIFNRANALLIDEAHNATGSIFQAVMRAAKEKAAADRAGGNVQNSLDIFGVTASPITKTQRTVELYDASYWAGIDQVGTWSHLVKSGRHRPTQVLEWARIWEQYHRARDRGEINASEPLFFKPDEHGFNFTTIFKRAESGTHSSVNLDRLKTIWPKIAEMIEGHGPGVIKTYARDADDVAATLSALSGKNFVSLQGLSETARAEVFDAFRNQTEYKGKKVDAIVVARVIEGLDFPKAGWYLSFKKYVKFPENIQDPGRVVRLALDKLSPKIIFFGEEVDKVAYEDVRELIMRRAGRLPRSMPEGSLFSGRRNEQLRKDLNETADRLNVAIEYFLRSHGDLTKQLGDARQMDPQKIADAQQLLMEIRSSGQNREIALAVKELVAQVNAYPFFNGQLKSTWNLCDRLISLEKKGAEAIKKARLTADEKALITSPEAMAKVREFRALLPTIGPIPRTLVENLNLRPLNLGELTSAVNNFVSLNNKGPFSTNTDPLSLHSLVNEAVAAAPEQVWRRLSNEARIQLQSLFESSSKMSFEQSLELYFKNNSELPEFSLDQAGDPNRNTSDYVAQRLASEMISRLKEGDLNLEAMSPEFLKALESSETYNGLMLKAVDAVTKLALSGPGGDNLYIQRLIADGQLNYEMLMRTGDFRILQILKAMAEKFPNSASGEYYRKLRVILR